MASKPKLPPAKFREWASALIRLENLADAACYVQEGCGKQRELLRKLVSESRDLRESFVRQMEEKCAGK